MAITPHVPSEEEFKSELRRHLVSVECINEKKIDNYVYKLTLRECLQWIGYALVLKIKDPKTKNLYGQLGQILILKWQLLGNLYLTMTQCREMTRIF